MAYVAAGRFDGYWEPGLHPWDIGAGILLVREAGGFVEPLTEGGKLSISGNGVIAANANVHGRLMEVVRGV